MNGLIELIFVTPSPPANRAHTAREHKLNTLTHITLLPTDVYIRHTGTHNPPPPPPQYKPPPIPTYTHNTNTHTRLTNHIETHAFARYSLSFISIAIILVNGVFRPESVTPFGDFKFPSEAKKLERAKFVKGQSLKRIA